MKTLDRFNKKILSILLQEGRLPISHLATRVGISKSPCQARVKKLEEEGYILGYKALLNHSKMGQELVAYAQVTMSDTRDPALKEFNQAVRKIAEVEECYMIAGAFDYLLKIRTSDINAYRTVLGESVSSLPHVASSSTFVSMQAVKER
jgi:Lrp/AsnC family leucine-responsive transcriptional regulator